MKLKPEPGIYKIENEITHEFYIGATRNIIKRKRSHYSDLRQGRHNNPNLQYGFNKGDNFSFSVLEYLDKSSSDDAIVRREQEWMEFLHPTLNSRNAIAIYGSEKDILRERKLAQRVGTIPSQETRDKRSISLKKYWETHEHIKCPLERREQLSERMKGEGHHNWGKDTPEEVRGKIANTLACTYHFTNESGEVLNITNMKKFNRENGMWGLGNLQVGRGEYQGWKLVSMEKPIPKGRRSEFVKSEKIK